MSSIPFEIYYIIDNTSSNNIQFFVYGTVGNFTIDWGFEAAQTYALRSDGNYPHGYFKGRGSATSGVIKIYTNSVWSQHHKQILSIS